MTSTPFNLYTAKTANKSPKVRVYLGPSDGSAIVFVESFDLIPLEVVRIAGSRPDYAVFEWKTEEFAEAVDATGTVTGDTSEVSFNRQVFVEIESHDKETTMVLFWGELLTETLRIEPGTQRITITASVADYHFGDLLEGEYHYNPLDESFHLVPIDPRFNPLIDGVIELNAGIQSLYNYSSNLLNGFTFETMPNLWVDPESVRTFFARDLIDLSISGQNEDAEHLTGKEWTLSTIVNTLSRLLLVDEEFLRPPTGHVPLGLPAAGTIWEHAPQVKNLRLKRGRHLNHLLDQVLQPHGYDWYLSHEGASTEKPIITVFRRGEGVKRWLKLQPVGEELDPAKSNTPHITVQTDVGNLANELHGWGSLEQKEITIELYRGWATVYDTFSAEDLRRSDPDSFYHSIAASQPAWRVWVGNEAGDYTNTRITTQPISEVLDLSSVFGLAIPRRREIDYCLTKDANGKRRIPHLEWSDDNGVTWKEVPPGTWVALRDQIGIKFTTDAPPEEMIDAGDDCKLRITCTITGDERLNATQTPELDESPSLRTVPLYLDLSDRYHKRSVQATGPLASVLAGNEHGADEVDDTTALETFLGDTLEAEKSAEMKCDFRLHGIQTQFEISDVITFIDGRDIFLNRNKHDPDFKALRKYVQVYGVRYVFQEQVTELIVEDVD